MDADVLIVRGLKVNFYTYDGVVKALDGIDLEVEPGETLGLVGETGCGKSVTVNSLVKLIPIPPGKIEGGRALLRWPIPCPECRGEGCDACGGTGFRGRSGIFELLPVTASIKELILARPDAGALRTRAAAEGMRPLREDGWEKVRRGITTIEEVLRVTRAG